MHNHNLNSKKRLYYKIFVAIQANDVAQVNNLLTAEVIEFATIKCMLYFLKMSMNDDESNRDVCKLLFNKFTVNKVLQWSCQTDDLELINRFVKCNRLVKHRLFQNNALQICAKFNSVKVCKLLMEEGADVNQSTNENGVTPLHTACLHGNIDIVKLLSSHNAIDLNKMDTRNRNAFHYACFGTINFNILKFMLGLKWLDKNRLDQDGNSPFSIACLWNARETVELLLMDSNIRIDENNPHVKTFKIENLDLFSKRIKF